MSAFTAAGSGTSSEALGTNATNIERPAVGDGIGVVRGAEDDIWAVPPGSQLRTLGSMPWWGWLGEACAARSAPSRALRRGSVRAFATLAHRSGLRTTSARRGPQAEQEDHVRAEADDRSQAGPWPAGSYNR
jgi:hypothetical protein